MGSSLAGCAKTALRTLAHWVSARRAGNDVREAWREMEAFQWLSPKAVREAQWKLLSGLLRHAYEMVTAGDGAAIAARLNRWRPALISGFPSLLGLAAAALRQGGHTLSFRPRAVVYHSENIDPYAFDPTREVFGAPVRSRYGCREFGPSWPKHAPSTLPAEASPGRTCTSTRPASTSRSSTARAGRSNRARRAASSSPTSGTA